LVSLVSLVSWFHWFHGFIGFMASGKRFRRSMPKYAISPYPGRQSTNESFLPPERALRRPDWVGRRVPPVR
jgi:hypothetical protein